MIAIRLGRKLQWDPAQEEFVNDAEAEQYIATGRCVKPYDYSMVG